jgi:hypothetical protein
MGLATGFRSPVAVFLPAVISLDLLPEGDGGGRGFAGGVALARGRVRPVTSNSHLAPSGSPSSPDGGFVCMFPIQAGSTRSYARKSDPR